MALPRLGSLRFLAAATAVMVACLLAGGAAAEEHSHPAGHWPHGRALHADPAPATPATATTSPAATPLPPIRPTTRCKAKLPAALQRTAAGNSTARPQNMSPSRRAPARGRLPRRADLQQVLALIAAGSPTFVDPRFSTHHCIDGRHEAGGVHTPGGDISEFLLALAGYQEAALAGAALPEAHVYEAMVAFIDAYAVPGERPFYMHTDHRADAHMRAAAGVDAAYSFRGAPAEDRDRLLALATDPEAVGCGHLKRTLQHPDVYRTPAALTANVLRAFWRALWRDADAGTGAVLLHTLHDDADEGAMVVVTGAACGDSVMTFNPKVAGMGQVLVYQPEAPAHLRQTLARFLCDRRPALAADAACSAGAVRAAMERIFAAGLASTVAAAAADRPQDSVVAAAEAPFAGVRTAEPAPPESAAAAAEAAYAAAGGNTGCAGTLVTADTLAGSRASSETWRILSQPQAAALTAAGPAFVPVDGHTWSCIDGRSQKAVLGTPGGSFSEFLLALAGHLRAGLVLPDEDTMQALLDAYAAQYATPFYRQVYMHSDAAAVKALAAKLGVSSLDLAAPPAALRARVLAHVADPAYIGCEHLRLTLQKPEVYGIDAKTAQWAVRAFFRALWADTARGAGRFAFEARPAPPSPRPASSSWRRVRGRGRGRAGAGGGPRGGRRAHGLLWRLPGPHGSHCADAPAAGLGSAPALGSGSALVYHYHDITGLRDWNAEFFTEWFNPRLASPTAGATRAALRSLMDTIFAPQLGSTAPAMSSGLPQYWAMVSASSDAALLSALAADRDAASGVAAGSKGGAELVLPGYSCSSFTRASFDALKEGIAGTLGIGASRVLLSRLRCALYTKPFPAASRRLLAEAAAASSGSGSGAGAGAGATGTLVPAVGVELLAPAAGSAEKGLTEALAAMKAATSPAGLLSLPGGFVADVAYPSTASGGDGSIKTEAWLIPSIFVGLIAVTVGSLGYVKRSQQQRERRKERAEQEQKLGGAFPAIPLVVPGAGAAQPPPPPPALRPATPRGAAYKAVDVDLDGPGGGFGQQAARAGAARGPGTPRGVQFREPHDFV
eukprot:tig00001033_g6486.t1